MRASDAGIMGVFTRLTVLLPSSSSSSIQTSSTRADSCTSATWEIMKIWPNERLRRSSASNTLLRRPASRLPKTSSRTRNPKCCRRGRPRSSERHPCGEAGNVGLAPGEALDGVGVIEAVEELHPVIVVELHPLVAAVCELSHQVGRLDLEHGPRPRRQAAEELGEEAVHLVHAGGGGRLLVGQLPVVVETFQFCSGDLDAVFGILPLVPSPRARPAAS